MTQINNYEDKDIKMILLTHIYISLHRVASYYYLLQRENACPTLRAGLIYTLRLSVHLSHSPTSPMCSAAALLYIGMEIRGVGREKRQNAV